MLDRKECLLLHPLWIAMDFNPFNKKEEHVPRHIELTAVPIVISEQTKRE